MAEERVCVGRWGGREKVNNNFYWIPHIFSHLHIIPLVESSGDVANSSRACELLGPAEADGRARRANRSASLGDTACCVSSRTREIL
ncbi:hypothetical protein GQ55_7G291200 [Panicum hallii var. hallii]|uniref:Uncharacterized protein n=1 Tax=Panicum hallii var. hallii TaxID=1504633 RepID=A0A2T7D0B2_9POAL|nr:hypothetical protein GQ55_7G291200 [Panicum hallii var. hallii]